ncbi:MAG TPA: protein-disulfide reductase DsbD N-terminal domain-containing protein [Candidatus Acidoferrum sp.]|nr:protein-disulfide reductase DsbD N-terminal domain-containing protein [Candidatus Acidoferrum sp.]
MKIRSLLASTLLIFSTCLLAIVSANSQQIIPAREVVLPAAYSSFDPVARGHEMQVAVVLKIRDGYHINARKPTLDYLIPTDLKVEPPAGFQAGEVSYPKGQLKNFAFSKNQPLNVYEGTVVLRLPVTVSKEAVAGEQHIPLKLRYQACSQEVCLPPVTLNLAAAVKVVSLPSAAKPAHADLFAPHP